MRRLTVRQQEIFCVVLIFLTTIALFWDTCSLPMMGDALLHMDDVTFFHSFGDFFRPFYSLSGIKENVNNPVINFHRPIFDEYLVPLLKTIFNNNTFLIRGASLIVFAGINSCSFIVGYILSKQKLLNGLLCAIMTMFSLTYLFPLMDWGLSFSLWLTFFALLAFLCICLYERNERNVFLIFSVVFTLIATFIKESAMTLSVALCLYVLFVTLLKDRRINVKLVIYCGLQFIVFVSYFITKIIKLGVFFNSAIVGGGNASGYSPTPMSILNKMYIYFLYCFNIPARAFPDYMMRHLSDINLGAALLLVALFILFIGCCIVQFANRPKEHSRMVIGFIVFLILMLPSVTVERNGIYYNDLAMIGILVIIATIDFGACKIGGCAFMSMYVLAYILIAKAMYLSNDQYLIKGEYQLREIRDELQNYNFTDKRVIQMSSFEANSEMHWYVNNVNTGTFFKYNVDDKAEISNITKDFEKMDLGKEIYIDYWTFQNDYYDPLVIVINENTAKEYTIVRIKPVDSIASFNLQMEYLGNTYYRWIDTQYYMQSEENEFLYYALPRESHLIYDENMVEEVRYFNAE